ncbi:MAG: hypothetical protein Ct9H300mP28_35140 [Pseudomonadota bacterium]|nr:MAG: hypothetical protein Ct9H300mP28_35140 [Pseudomonadota bacterium]
MQIKFLFSAVFAALVLFVSSAASAITIEVGYPYSALFDVTIKDNIVPMLKKLTPGLRSNFVLPMITMKMPLTPFYENL